jgi:hypothetical protein
MATTNNYILRFGGSDITVVANYSAILALPPVTGKFYWASASQGTSWLPGSLGGTYYNSGLYYYNGASLEFMNVPYQATLAEVIAEINTDKFVTPSTLGGWWDVKKDDIVINENQVRILKENLASQGRSFHTLDIVGNRLIAGERAFGDRPARLLIYQDYNDLSTCQTIELTQSVIGTPIAPGVGGIETICFHDGFAYAPLSFTSRIIKVNLSDATFTVTTITGMPSGCSFEGSCSILTDGSSLFIGTETLTSWVVKLNITTLAFVQAVVTGYAGIHGGAIVQSTGKLFFSTNSSATVMKFDKTTLALENVNVLPSTGLTDDMAIIYEEFIIVGSEAPTNPIGGSFVLSQTDLSLQKTLKTFKTFGCFFDGDETIYILSDLGYIQTVNYFALGDSISFDTDITPFIKTYAMPTYQPNEITFAGVAPNFRIFCSVWQSNGRPSIKEIDFLTSATPVLYRDEYLEILKFQTALEELENVRSTNYPNPIDTDSVLIFDVTTSLWKRLTWANVKSSLSGFVVVSSNTIAVNDTNYTVVANATFTDPTPVEGKGYVIFVRNGTATIGGIGYASGRLIYRVFHSGAWTSTVYVDKVYVDNGLATKEPTITAGTSAQYYRGDKTFQTLDKTAVGLANVDNTSDANKPVSTATQIALNAKVDISSRQIAMITANDPANNTTTPVVLTGHTFTIPAGKTAEITAIMMFTTASASVGAIYGIRIANPVGASANVIGSTFITVGVSSAPSAGALQDGDNFNVAANANSFSNVIGTAATATNNNPANLIAIIRNLSTNTSATVTIEFASEVGGTDITPQLGTSATCQILN